MPQHSKVDSLLHRNVSYSPQGLRSSYNRKSVTKFFSIFQFHFIAFLLKLQEPVSWFLRQRGLPLSSVSTSKIAICCIYIFSFWLSWLMFSQEFVFKRQHLPFRRIVFQADKAGVPVRNALNTMVNPTKINFLRLA